jgi:hypothetical protein
VTPAWSAFAVAPGKCQLDLKWVAAEVPTTGNRHG